MHSTGTSTVPLSSSPTDTYDFAIGLIGWKPVLCSVHAKADIY